jgi:hypothetical protein
VDASSPRAAVAMPRRSGTQPQASAGVAKQQRCPAETGRLRPRHQTGLGKELLSRVPPSSKGLGSGWMSLPEVIFAHLGMWFGTRPCKHRAARCFGYAERHLRRQRRPDRGRPSRECARPDWVDAALTAVCPDANVPLGSQREDRDAVAITAEGIEHERQTLPFGCGRFGNAPRAAGGNLGAKRVTAGGWRARCVGGANALVVHRIKTGGCICARPEHVS